MDTVVDNKNKTDTNMCEFTGAGSVYKVIEQYKQAEFDKSGQKALCIKLEPVQKKVKSIN
tara:strand:+ start:2137 stop:2316 length:180 start_codon:yes stop_codon:yes gene_type:complete